MSMGISGGRRVIVETRAGGAVTVTAQAAATRVVEVGSAAAELHAARAAAAAAGAAQAAAVGAEAGAEAARIAALAARDAAQGFADALLGSSATVLAVGTGEKVLATEPDRRWTPGQRLRLAAAGGAATMDGTVIAYAGGVLTILVDHAVGEGDHATWTIMLSGAIGPPGPQGEMGPAGPQGAQGLQGPQGMAGPEGPAGTPGAPGADGTDGLEGADGADGWSPMLAVAEDGARRVLHVTGWTGGGGAAPAPGYVGPSGLVTDAASGVDIRGPAGSGTGDVVGPTSAVDGHVALFDGTSGRVLRSAGVQLTAAAIGAATAAHSHPLAAIPDAGALAGKDQVGTAELADDAVTDMKLRDSAALSVIGRAGNSAGDPADIVASFDGHVLRRSGSAIGFGAIAAAGISNNAVTNAKLADMAPGTVKGRVSGGAGDPQDLTVEELRALLGHPPTAPDQALVRFDGTGGALQGSVVQLSDEGDLTGLRDIASAGSRA